jgi:hypothetical protein
LPVEGYCVRVQKKELEKLGGYRRRKNRGDGVGMRGVSGRYRKRRECACHSG